MLGFAAAAVGWPMRTRRVRRMNVSGGEASECGSRGCGFVYASAGAAWPLSRCSWRLVFDGLQDRTEEADD